MQDDGCHSLIGMASDIIAQFLDKIIAVGEICNECDLTVVRVLGLLCESYAFLWPLACPK